MLIARFRIVIFTAFAGWAIVAMHPATADSQVLDQLRQDVRDGVAPSQSDSKPDKKPDNSNRSNDPDSGGGAGSVSFEAVGNAISAPFWIPNHIFDEGVDFPGFFLRYPYWHNEEGSMFFVRPDGAWLRSWQTEFSYEYGNTFDDLSRSGGRFRLSTTSRVDFETNWDTLSEQTPQGHDHVTMGDVDLLYRFAQSKRIQFRSGLGANWFDDHQGVVAGFNFRYGVDYYPCKPWAFSTLVDIGELGKSSLVQVRATAGIVYKRWELYSGYDYRKIGSVEFDGPLAGVKFRY